MASASEQDDSGKQVQKDSIVEEDEASNTASHEKQKEESASTKKESESTEEKAEPKGKATAKEATNYDSDNQNSIWQSVLGKNLASPPPVRRAAKAASKNIAAKSHVIPKKAPVAKKKKASVKAKKPIAKKMTAKKATTKKATAKGGKSASKKKATATAKSNNGKSKGKASSKKEAVAAPEPISSHGLDLFTKHYREFERALTRLEKIDQFSYFWDPCPEDKLEDYTPKELATAEDGDKEMRGAETSTTTAPTTATGTATTETSTYPSHPPFNFEMIRRRRDHGRYILDYQASEQERLNMIKSYLQEENGPQPFKRVSLVHPRGVNWDLFRKDVSGMCDDALENHPDGPGDGKTGSLLYAVRKIKGELEKIYERTARRHLGEIMVANGRSQFNSAIEQSTNTAAAFQGKWRQKPFPERKYERLPTKNVVCAGLSELDERIASYELQTSLPDSFVGIAYKYEDNTGKSEAWMKSVLSETGDRKGKKKAQETALALAKDEGVIRSQVLIAMEALLIAVQDNVMTDAGVLKRSELRSANWEADAAVTTCVDNERKQETSNTIESNTVIEDEDARMLSDSISGKPIDDAASNDDVLSGETADLSAGESTRSVIASENAPTEADASLPKEESSELDGDMMRGNADAKTDGTLSQSAAATAAKNSATASSANAVPPVGTPAKFASAAQSIAVPGEDNDELAKDDRAVEATSHSKTETLDTHTDNNEDAISAATSPDKNVLVLEKSTTSDAFNDEPNRDLKEPSASKAQEDTTATLPKKSGEALESSTTTDAATDNKSDSLPNSDNAGDLNNSSAKDDVEARDSTACNDDIMEEAEESLPDSTPDIVEQPVWGIDCYTRQNVLICLATEFDDETALVFIEKWLLPAINACPVDLAHDIANAALVLEGLPFMTRSDEVNGVGESEQNKDQIAETEERWSHSLIGKSLKNKIRLTGPPWLKLAAQLLRRAREVMGPDFFRIHPKGHGSIVLRPKIPPNSLVTFYRGEVYPSWRWGEKTDAIDITQKRKKLKPNLPDFYNMALERPQKDPRKYGLLFVDASRKAGHGSSISHSCAPTCEVRVAALNGELCLAMTTLRDIEMGEELTFDYNAVTESLVEYRSAICLCGYGKCRGSFLHFAAADCYQRVLDRNAPIAVRFASLAKGCLKEIMSEEDERTLQNHGFMTAAFGAISVNRHTTSGSEAKEALVDSMDNVPVWLRTYVADTLRYIEYERRALPISLICEDLSKPNTDNAANKDPVGSKKSKAAPPLEEAKVNPDDEEASDDDSDPDDKPIKGSKPMPTFFFYTRANKALFVKMLKDDGIEEKDLRGLEMSRALKRLGGEQWKLLTEAEKAKWKQKAEKEWIKNGGLELALLEKQRKAGGLVEGNVKAKAKKRRKGPKQESLESKLESSNISFQTADAEGVAAMEQRVQQLTQSLSRVGRVLDRHRETFHVAESKALGTSADTLRSQVFPPLAVATDEQVVSWLWNDENSLVRTLLAKTETLECASPELKEAFISITKRFEVLDKFGSHSALPSEFPIKPSQARRKLTVALMEFRRAILRDLKAMGKDLKKEKLKKKANKKKLLLEAKQRKKAAKGAVNAKESIDAELEEDQELLEDQQPNSPKPICPERGAVDADGDADHENSMHIHKEAEDNEAVADLSSAMNGEVGSGTREDQEEASTEPLCPPAEENETTDETGAVAGSEEPAEVPPAKEPASVSHSKIECLPVSAQSEETSAAHEDESVAAVTAETTLSTGIITEDNGKAASSVVHAQTPKEVLQAIPTGEELTQMNGKQVSGQASLTDEDISPANPEQASESLHVIAPESFSVSAPDAEMKDARTDAKVVVADMLCHLVDGAVAKAEGTKADAAAAAAAELKAKQKEEYENRPKPWLKHYGQRFKLQAAADVLLFYARTSTFFLLQPYEPLKSTPIEVYAREIGNAVPKTVIDTSVSEKLKNDNGIVEVTSDSMDVPAQLAEPEVEVKKISKKSKRAPEKAQEEEPAVEVELCQPDDIVAEVTVEYQGDYVLSQLVQWYNGGIGQTAGLPDSLGCIRLPSISGCWDMEDSASEKPKLSKPTTYEATTRPRLVSWFSDPHQRGSPWPEELRAAFGYKDSEDLPKDTSSIWLPLGSPVLDLLVTGDDFNISSILEEFGADDENKKTEKGLISTLDEGRPAQAVSNWVQCENPACGKWRKIPWHVDIDVLAKSFVCSDNKWNRASSSCDAPEDEYQKRENDVVGPDGQLRVMTPSPVKKRPSKRKNLDLVSKKGSDGTKIAKKKKLEGKQSHEEAAKKKEEAAKKKEEATQKRRVLLKKKEEEKKKKEDAIREREAADIPIPVEEEKIVVGARFDVKRGKKLLYAVGKVVEVVEESGVRKVKFHFTGRDAKYDEWLETTSPRICPLWSKCSKRVQKPRKPKESEGIPGANSKVDKSAEKAVAAGVPVAPDVNPSELAEAMSYANTQAETLEGGVLPASECQLNGGEIKKKKKKKKKKKRKLVEGGDTATMNASEGAFAYAAPAEKSGQHQTDATISKPRKKSPKLTSTASPLSSLSGPQGSLASAVVSADVQSAIAGLASLAGQTPRKPPEAAGGMQPSIVQSAVLHNPVASQVPSPPRPSVTSTSQQSLQLQERIRQQEAELLLVQDAARRQQQLRAPSQSPLQAISQLYGAIDNQAQRQRAEEALQRQLLQQALGAEIQRQRIAIPGESHYASMSSQAYRPADGASAAQALEIIRQQQQQQPQQRSNPNPRSPFDYTSFGNGRR